VRLEVERLVRTHPGAAAPVLREVSFTLESGAWAALLGRSGAGKSTLLRCLVGLEPFERGRIRLDEVEVRGTHEAPRAGRERAVARLRARLGVVFQSFELFAHLSALDNCTLAPVHVAGLARAQAEERAGALLAGLGLAERAGAYPEQLSGGQKQRVAIARALAMEPRVLLYDEPTSALDPALKHEVLQTLQRVDATGVTQLVVTHDLALARAAEQVFVLEAGQVIEQGRAAEVLERPRHDSTRQLLAHWGEQERVRPPG
jgi:ABC-type polar amino acid transport system ATPase subunit